MALNRTSALPPLIFLRRERKYVLNVPIHPSALLKIHAPKLHLLLLLLWHVRDQNHELCLDINRHLPGMRPIARHLRSLSSTVYVTRDWNDGGEWFQWRTAKRMICSQDRRDDFHVSESLLLSL